jgi:hypothetical protein
VRHTGSTRAIYESRVYAAIGSGMTELSGVRALEAASGLGRQTLLDTLPDQGTASEYGLIIGHSRGTFDYDKPEVGEYSFADLGKCDTGWIRNTFGRGSSISMTRTGVVSPLSTPEDQVEHPEHSARAGVPDLAGVLLAAADRLRREEVRLALDPSLDSWAPYGRDTPTRVGHRGWALALVLGLQDCELTLSQVQMLTGLSERQNRALVERLETAGLAYRVRRGRATHVCFCFDSVLVNPYAMSYDPDADRAERARKKRERAYWEAACLRSRRTPHGQRAWQLIRFFRPDETTPPQVIDLMRYRNQLQLAKLLESEFTWKAA